MTQKTFKTNPFNTKKSIEKAALQEDDQKIWRIDTAGKAYLWAGNIPYTFRNVLAEEGTSVTVIIA